MSESRIDELEQKIAHLEYTLDDLDAYTQKLSALLDACQRHCQMLEKKIEALESDSYHDLNESAKPPHY